MQKKNKMRITIIGRPISKKNSKQLIPVRGRTIMIPSKAYNRFRKDALKQLMIYSGVGTYIPPYKMKFRFEMKGKLDTDIDNMISGITDILQDFGLIEDDKYVMAVEAEKVGGFENWKTLIELESYASNTKKT